MNTLTDFMRGAYDLWRTSDPSCHEFEPSDSQLAEQMGLIKKDIEANGDSVDELVSKLDESGLLPDLVRQFMCHDQASAVGVISDHFSGALDEMAHARAVKKHG